MKHLSIFLCCVGLCLLSWSCNGRKPSFEVKDIDVEIKKDRVLPLQAELFQGDDICSYSSSGGGSRFGFLTSDGKKSFSLREQYDLDYYQDCRISTREGLVKINAFDVYRINPDWSISLASDAKGIALVKSNTQVLAFLMTNINSFVLNRAFFSISRKGYALFDAEGDVEFKGLVVTVQMPEIGEKQRYLIPLYDFVNDAEPVFDDNVDQLLMPNKDYFWCKSDTTLILPCFGSQPEITWTNENGVCTVVVKDAKGRGDDAVFRLPGEYPFVANPVYTGFSRQPEEVDYEIAAAAFGLSNGRMLNILQYTDPVDQLEQYRVNNTGFVKEKTPHFPNGYASYVKVYSFRTKKFTQHILPIYLPE